VNIKTVIHCDINISAFLQQQSLYGLSTVQTKPTAE